MTTTKTTMLKYLVIILTGLAVGVLTKVATLLGLLDLQASTAGYLVAVIALGVEISYDLRRHHLYRFDRWLTNYLDTAKPSKSKAERAKRDREVAERIKPLERD